MSTHVKESTPKASTRELEADRIFNQALFRTMGFAAAGFGAGLAASLFFKHRVAMSFLGAGAGATYGAMGFYNDYARFQKYKSMGQGQSQEGKSRSQFNESQSNFKDLSAFMKTQHTQGQQKQDQQRDDSSSQQKRDSNINQRSNMQAQRTQEPQKRDQQRDDSSSQQKRDSNINQRSNMQAQRTQEPQKREQPKRDQQKDDNSSQQKRDSNINQRSDMQAKRTQEPQKREQGDKGTQNKVDVKDGQTFQNFESNPNKPGKPEGPGFSPKKDYQLNRNQAKDQDVQTKRSFNQNLEQDKLKESMKTGNNMRLEERSDTQAGAHGYKPGAPTLEKNQINAVIE
jgi:hypothetical protein